MTEERNPTIGESLRDAMATYSEADGPPDDANIEAAETETEALDDGEELAVEAQGSDDADDSGENESTEGEDAVEQGIQAPETWSEEDQNAFMEMSEEAQTVLMGIHKNMEAGLTKGQTEIADARKRYSAIDSFFDSFQQTYMPEQEKNVVESAIMDALPTVLGYYMQLASDPVATLVQLAETYKATDALSEALSGYTVDEGTSDVLKENAALKKQMRDIEFQQKQSESQSAKDVIDVFSNEQTDDGVPKHPYFDDVRGTMHVLMSGDDKLDLESAYQKAVLIDKHDEVMTQKEQDIKDKLNADRKASAKTARKTPRQTKGKSGSSQRGVKEDEVPKKLGDHLRLELERLNEDVEG